MRLVSQQKYPVFPNFQVRYIRTPAENFFILWHPPVVKVLSTA